MSCRLECNIIEPLDNEAILTVTAPEVLTTLTRATASNSTDISILANSGKFSTILKLQVEVIAEKPVEPAIDYLSIYQKGETLFTIGDGDGAIEINSTNFPVSQEIDLSETDQTLEKQYSPRLNQRFISYRESTFLILPWMEIKL